MRAAVPVLSSLLLIVGCGGGDDGVSGDDEPGHDASSFDAGPSPDANDIDGGPLDPAVLHEVAIVMTEANLDDFDDDQTTRVPCDVTWDGEPLAQSGCRKKGTGGSVDPVVGKPAFSIKFDDFVAGQKLGQFDKLTLNNGLQDLSLLEEHVAYEVFRRMGVPAHRTAFAVVTLNGEPKGIYVAVEPVDKEFLRDRYGSANDEGNLYESQSVDFALAPENMDLKDEDEGRTRDDLIAAAAAVTGASDGAFAAEVGALIDLDNFARHYAAEILIDSRDGHAFARNNYYLYHRPDTDRLVFLPHGQDVILFDPGFDVDYPPAATLAARVRDIPALAAHVDALVAAAVQPGGALDAAELDARIDAALAVVQTTTRDDDFTAGDLANMTRLGPELSARIAWRARFLRGEVSAQECGDGVVQLIEGCDDGGTDIGDGCDDECYPECYTITGAGETWRLCPAIRDRATAAAMCAPGGGSLVVPASVDEAATISGLIRRHLGSTDVWLGITDKSVEGSWQVDGAGAPPYDGFVGSEPNGGGSENCAVFDTSSEGGWYDQPCDVGYAALCRLP